MALTAFNEDMEIISKLSDLPNDTDGLTAAELKARFDRAGTLLKAYINGTLLSELSGSGAAGSLGVDKVNGTDMGSTVQAALDALAAQIVEATLGTIPDKSIGESKFADLAVSTRTLSELAVTAAKIAAGAVTDEKTDFSAGFAPAGPIRLIRGVHYFGSEAELPAATDEGRVYFVEVS